MIVQQCCTLSDSPEDISLFYTKRETDYFWADAIDFDWTFNDGFYHCF